jgi:hypothetical protein
MKSPNSVRLKKYGIVYNDYMKKNVVVKVKSPPKKVIKESTKQPVKTSKKTLNDYQKFVQEESSKDKYKNMKGSERMSRISQEWEKKKRKDRKKK